MKNHTTIYFSKNNKKEFVTLYFAITYSDVRKVKGES